MATQGCPCGNYGNPNGTCTCTQTQIQGYMSRISGSLLDRIDIHVEVPAVKYAEFSSKRSGEPSAAVRAKVKKAREAQRERFRGRKGLFKNADMSRPEVHLRDRDPVDRARSGRAGAIASASGGSSIEVELGIEYGLSTCIGTEHECIKTAHCS